MRCLENLTCKIVVRIVDLCAVDSDGVDGVDRNLYSEWIESQVFFPFLAIKLAIPPTLYSQPWLSGTPKKQFECSA
jgi:hypothetical protein